MLIFVAFFTTLVAAGFGQDTVTVTTEQQGTFVGRREVVAGFTYNVFRGIRYAKAPTGRLRWAPPEPVWTDRRLQATAFGNQCPQTALFGSTAPNSEDCLFLNVFVEQSLARPGANTPVLVIIHGGGFTEGTAESYDYNGIVRNLASRGIVVVSINYRLGALGFLVDQATKTIGNFGILDQLEALRWVQRNIGAFGGDPRRVTVYGESAGSISVSLLTMMPAADDLFQQVFLQSGGIYVPTWFFSDENTKVVENSQIVAEELGCATAASYYDCLRDTTWERLLDVSPADTLDMLQPNASLPKFEPSMTIAWGPIVESDWVLRALEGRRRPRPTLAGVDRDEMSLFVLPTWFPNATYTHFNADSLALHLPGLLAMHGQNPQDRRLVDRGVEMYSQLRQDQRADDPNTWLEQTIKMYSDSSLLVPTYLDALAAAGQGSRAYLFSFDQVAIDMQPQAPYEMIPHGVDIGYMLATFNGTFLPFEPSADDLLAAEYYGQMTADFVKTGNPSSTSDSSLPAWPSLTERVAQTGGSAMYLSLSAQPAVRPLSQFHPASNYWLYDVIGRSQPTLLDPAQES